LTPLLSCSPLDAAPFDFASFGYASLDVARDRQGRQKKNVFMRDAVFAVFAVLTVFPFDFWGQKTRSQK
jgi:hypothetical protein